MKKPVDLKHRLDTLRDEPEVPITVTLHLEAAVYRALQVQARRARVSPEAYIAALLTRHIQNE